MAAIVKAHVLEGVPIEGPMDSEAARVGALQIAGALGAAHARGILHRDLKPGNVLMTASGVTLVDFGLAKLTADADGPTMQTLPGAVLGTAAYMAPEQAQGYAADARSDIFSVGAVLYELLSGARAFRGASLLATLDAVVRHEPPTVAVSAHADCIEVPGQGSCPAIPERGRSGGCVARMRASD
jgi:serine/threonine protein kinase